MINKQAINRQPIYRNQKKQNRLINIFNRICVLFNKFIKLVFAFIFTLTTWFTIYHLLQLLTRSNIDGDDTTTTTTNNILNSVPTYDMIQDLFIDAILVSSFIIIHSFMASNTYKQFIKRSYFFYPLERSMYNFFTSISIEIMILNWRSIDQFIIWDLSNYSNSLSIVKSIFLIWTLIEFIVFLKFWEFFGLVQVWYFCIKDLDYQLTVPISLKNKLDSKMRHPNTVSLFVIIWFSACKMTLDLFTIASFFTFYLLYGNSIKDKRENSNNGNTTMEFITPSPPPTIKID